MKKHLTRILSVCMVLSMLLAMVVVPASAETAEDSLAQQIAAATADAPAVITLAQDVTLTKTISIPAGATVEIKSSVGSVLTRGSALVGALFDVPVGSTLKLTGTKDAPITLSGASVQASTAMITSKGSVVLENALLKDAVSSGTGGAVYLSAGSLKATDTRFENNSAKTGGAIDTVKNGISLTLNGGSFTGNTATTNGGAINLLDKNTMTATGVQFTGNKTTASAANKGGAAAYVANASASFENCTFNNNAVSGESASVGGAICFYALSASQTTCTVKSCSFTENTAPNGGALGLSDSGSKERASRAVVNWSDCTFTGNTASGKGNAIAIPYDCSKLMNCAVSIDGCTYNGSSAATDSDFYTAAKANITVNGTPLDSSTPTVDPNYTAYTHVSKVPDVTINGKEMPDLAGMGIAGDYAYSIKLKTAAKPSGDTTNYHLGEPATLWRTDLKTGKTVQMSEAATGNKLIDYVGHANGVAGAVINGETYLYVATLLVGDAENTPAVVKLHVTGETFEKVGTYNVLEGSTLKSRSGIDVLSVDAEKTTLLLKTGGNFFTAQLPHTQTSGNLQSVMQFSINMSAVSLTNGTVLDVSDWTWQDCGYHDGRLYVPVCKGLSSVVAVFSVLDDQGNLKSGTLNPDKNCSVQLGDAEHRMVEVESCAVYNDKLYFNANRTLQDGSSDCDGVCYTELPPAASEEKPADNPAQDALVRQIQAAAGSSVTITLPQDITLTSTISIPANTVVELKVGDGAVLTRGAELTDALFQVPAGSTLKLTGTKDTPLTLNGASVQASTAMITSEGSVVLENALLKDAVSSSTGGAVYLSAGSLTATDTRFENNSAKSGGAIDTASKNGVSLTLNGGSFTGNTAKTNGGAVNLLDKNTMTANGVQFTGNKTTASAANKGGGAVYVANTSAEFSACTFDGNSVSGNSTSNGGAICFYALGASKNKCSVKGSAFTRNTAPNGGAVGISDNGKPRSAKSSVALERCTFSENAAQDKGGAITIPYATKALSCTVTLTDCTYTANQAATANDLYTVQEADEGVIIVSTPKEEEPGVVPPADKPGQEPQPASPAAPATGDRFSAALWSFLAAGSALSLLYLLRRREHSSH